MFQKNKFLEMPVFFFEKLWLNTPHWHKSEKQDKNNVYDFIVE